MLNAEFDIDLTAEEPNPTPPPEEPNPTPPPEALEKEHTPPPPQVAVATYPPSLPHDLACAMTPEEEEVIRLKYALSEAELTYICERQDFKREFSEWRQRLISEGNSFKLKLRAMAEEFLPTLHRIMSSELTAPSVKVDAFKYITKVAQLEPTKMELEGAGYDGGGPRITVQIANFTNPSETQVTPSRNTAHVQVTNTGGA